MLENDTRNYHLTAAQVSEVKLTQQEVRTGKIASDKQMREIWNNFGA